MHKENVDFRTTERDEMEKNTPMWHALRDPKTKNCQVTIKEQYYIMFWLGYFIRKIMHDDNLERIKQLNKENLKHWEKDMEIKDYYKNEANKIKQIQDSKLRGENKTQ